MKGLAIISGGADSATLAYLLKHDGHQLSAVAFNYGQRHARELTSAAAVAAALGIRLDVIDLSVLGGYLTSPVLTGNQPAPHGHYEAESMRQTVVPNRNAIMLSIAWGIAVARKLEFVAYGAHSGDHFIYPDCRPEFITALEFALQLGNRDDHANELDQCKLFAPFMRMDKGDIVRLGRKLGVPYEVTWTCYEGGAIPCGECGACNERAAAFAAAGVSDPLLQAAA